MGRKQKRTCLGLRFLVLIPVVIVLMPLPSATSFSWLSYHATMNELRTILGYNSEIADTIITNSVIWTGDSHLPWANSMAISQGRILSIGSFIDVQAKAGFKTHYVDLQGKFVTPGFIDSHVHFILGGVTMVHLNLRYVRSRSELVKKIESAVEGAKKGIWIMGGSWNNQLWGGDLPEASWIDGVTPDNPVWLIRLDGHMGFGNSLALAMAGIDSRTPDPEGGRIVKDPKGAPTGILAENAMTLVARILPETSIEDRQEGLRRASKHALSKGITSVVDFGCYLPGVSKEKPWNDLLEIYLWADSTSTLGIRVSAFMPLEIWPRVVKMVKNRGRVLSPWLRIGGVKAFADGSLGAGSARFHEPYADDPSNYGVYVTNPDWILEEAIGADKAGLQVAVHAIGDAAVDRMLLVVKALNSTNGRRDRRFRLEHVQHVAPGGPARVAASGVIASMQPQHLLDDAHYAAKKLGEERATQGSYVFSSLLGNGTKLAFGSDWKVVPLDALAGMRAAVNRRPEGWSTPWIGSECISMEAALKGYTVDAAYAGFMEEDVGSLAVGKLADFVVLSKNLLSSSTDPMPEVLFTYIGGSLAYSKLPSTF